MNFEMAKIKIIEINLIYRKSIEFKMKFIQRELPKVERNCGKKENCFVFEGGTVKY